MRVYLYTYGHAKIKQESYKSISMFDKTSTKIYKVFYR